MPIDPFSAGRVCPLCGRPIPDRHKSDLCCGQRLRGHHTVELRLVPGDDLVEVRFTHTRVMPRGWRRWAGRDVDGRWIVWDEIAS